MVHPCGAVQMSSADSFNFERINILSNSCYRYIEKLYRDNYRYIAKPYAGEMDESKNEQMLEGLYLCNSFLDMKWLYELLF